MSDRAELNLLALYHAIQVVLRHAEHRAIVVHRCHKRLKFIVQVARKVAKLLSRRYGRPDADDALRFVRVQTPQSLPKHNIGFSRACWSEDAQEPQRLVFRKLLYDLLLTWRVFETGAGTGAGDSEV